MDTDGEFLIGDEGTSFLRSQLSIRNNEAYVDYSEDPSIDPSTLPNENHIYKIYHEGNFDASAVHEITPTEVYTKLQSNTLPSPLELNVSQISGNTIDDISLVGHTHESTDITDFVTAARAQAELELKTIMNSAKGRGIDISFNDTTKALVYTAHSFSLSFVGGATGSKTVDTLSDTVISLTVDPDRHIHQDYLDTMAYLQSQINNINAMDPTNYYTKSEVDDNIAASSGTDTPTAGKPLLVNSDLILPGTAQSATKLSSDVTINFVGDITGVLTTDFSTNQSVELNAANIVSNTPVSGKALLVNSNGDLPGNAETSSALDHTIKLNLTGEATGSGELDTSKSSASINVILNPGDNILQTSDLGVTVAPISDDGTIPLQYIPADATGGLTPKGYFDPENGYPTDTPTEGDFYIASQSGTIDGETYNKGDWCVYLNGNWVHINILGGVTSVNSKTGAVTLTADDVGAISTDLIDYSSGTTIPSGYVVKTSDRGEITGASIESLINEFKVATDTGSDVEISSSSSNVDTNGTEDLGLLLKLTTQGYSNIQDKVGYTIQNSEGNFTHRPFLNFDNNFVITDNGSSTLNISLNGDTGSNNCLVVYYNYVTDNKEEVIEILNDYINNRSNKPIILISAINSTNKEFVLFAIDDQVSITSATTTTITYRGNAYLTTNTTYRTTLVNTPVYTLSITNTMNGTDIVVTDISITSSYTSATVLSTQNYSNTNYFSATYKSQPVSKGYLDDKVSELSTSLAGCTTTATSLTCTLPDSL